MILAVDFDGTLHDGEYPSIGEPRPGAADTLRALQEEGHTIIIWTCRRDGLLDEAVAWMEREGIPFDMVNEQDGSVLRTFGGDTRKIYADVYIDDRNIGGIPSWRVIYKRINQML